MVINVNRKALAAGAVSTADTVNRQALPAGVTWAVNVYLACNVGQY